MGDIPIPKFIDELDDNGLRAELTKNGVAIGPITPTTRRLLKRRLAKKLGVVAAFKSNQDANDGDLNSEKTTPDVTRSPCQIPSDVEKAKTAEKSSAKREREKHHFYGVFIPRTDTEIDVNEPLVFESQSNALLIIKGHKNARFKVFDSFEDAKDYSIKGIEEPLTTATSNTMGSEDAANKFPSLRQVDLNQLMRVIESSEIMQMRTLIWTNPRYLISSADGPVVLKPSTRYNALHIAAKANQPKICREILETIQNPDFQSMIFPNVADENVSNQRTEHLLDSYLNTPEKILYETPLHFACKMGYKDVVAELVSYSQCSVTATNNCGKTPGEITCSRASSKIDQAEIHRLLGEQYYVPLLRYHDNSEHAIVGTPITTKQDPGECSPRVPNCKKSPLMSSLSVSALAGPMPKDVAIQFQKSWMTPSKYERLPKSIRYLRRADSEKGDEQIGRQLAEKEHVGWVEYWDFLTDFANFATEEGLTKLEAYLNEKNTVFSPDQNPKESLSQDITQLANMLDGIHLGCSLENICQQDILGENSKQTLGSDESRSNTSQSSYETAPENMSPEETSIFKTPKTNPSRTQNLGNCNVSGHNEISTNFEDESKLVKRLFTDNSVENMTGIFTKSLSLVPQNAENNDNWFSSDTAVAYRSIDKSSSNVFSSPSHSDTSLNSSTIGYSCQIFLAGQVPTKLDRDVLLAIGDTDIDVMKFPSISEWKSAILSFSEHDRQKWATPRKERSFSFDFNRNSSIHNGHSSFTPTPSSGQRSFFTPNRDLRQFWYKPFTPPSAR